MWLKEIITNKAILALKVINCYDQNIGILQIEKMQLSFTDIK
jgi:hypothetical protein